jgi:FKBP-type peptidyl-prolyl cis-trans isomerase FkpA
MKLSNFRWKVLSLRIIVPVVLLVWSCADQTQEKKQAGPYSEAELKEQLINANKKTVKTEDQQIKDFLARNRWDMNQTGTGLRYRIYENRKGAPAVEGKIAVIQYEVSLLNGEVVYSSDDMGNKEFQIGRGGVESGLEEGILLMRVGDRAKFIIPSHLAFGLVGDQHKISSKTTLVYDVKLLNLK